MTTDQGADDLPNATDGDEERRLSRLETIAGAFDSCPHPLTVSLVSDSRIIEANRAMVETSGFTREQLIGRTPVEIGLFENVADREIVFEALKTRGTIVNFPVRFRRASGRSAECLFSSSVFKHRGEAFIVTLVDDVDDLRDAERALAVSEQRLKLALEGSSTALWEWLLPDETRVTFAHYEALLGYEEGSLKPGLEQLRALVHPDDWAMAVGTLRAHLEGKSPSWSIEFRMRPLSGSWLWVHASGSVVETLRDGSPRRVAGTLRDVTAQKLSEEALRLESERFRSLVHNSFDVVLVTTAEGIIQYATPSIRRVLGHEPSFMVGKNAFEFVDPDDLPLILEEFGSMLQKANSGIPTAFRSRTADGRFVHLEGLATNLLDQPAIEGVVIVLRDVTERREMEARILQSQKFESLGVLAGGVAHDFNNLLTSVLGNASFAAQILPPDSPARDLLDRVQVAARRAAELTRQLLSYAGQRTVQGQPVRISDLTLEMTELLRVSVGRKCTLTLDLPEDLPPVRADATQLRQVVMNLIMNAAESYGEAGGEVRVRAGVRDCDEASLRSCFFVSDRASPGQHVFVEVSDQGSGMSPEMLPRIFDPFFTTKFTGRGLGLASTLGVVRSHGGAISVQTAPGRGSVFTVLLRSDEKMSSHPPAREATLSSRPAPAHGAILVIDDEQAIREVCRAGLESQGFQVITAEDGASGLSAFAQWREQLRLVLLDVTMPNTDLLEVLAKIQREAPRLKVILTSGHAEDDVMRRLPAGSRPRFLQKPFSLEELLSTVNEAIER